MKTIKQLSEELKISKEAIYKKIRYQLKDSLENHVIKRNNVTHIDEIGEQIIIQSLNKERQEAIQVIIQSDTMNSEMDEAQEHVSEYIAILEMQLKNKDIQIEMQNNHISRLIKQLDANQFVMQEEETKETGETRETEVEMQHNTQEEIAVTKESATEEGTSVWKKIFRK